MARTILIFGQSGSGKTTSCRNLDPASTFFIDCDGKGLSWRGWRKSFNAQHKNYIATDIVDDKKKVSVQFLANVVATSDDYRHVKTLVIDGITTLMVTDEFRRRQEKTFDKYMDIAACIFDLCKNALKYRDDLTIVFIGHVDIERDINGTELFAQVKTTGQKLKRIVLESLFTTVLYAKFDGQKYIFETKSKLSTAKSPMDALPETVDNDINAVIQQLITYEEE